MQFIFNPVFTIWFLGMFSFILYRFKYVKLYKLISFVGIIYFFIITVTPLPQLLIRQLEQAYPVYYGGKCDSINILILGSGHISDSALYPLQQLSPVGVSRLAEGIRIYKKCNDSKLVFSGNAAIGRSSHAIVMSRSAVELGVKPNDTLCNVKPANTWQEAAVYKQRFGVKKPFILVTSAVHMPRAMYIFKRAGLNPVPAPTYFFVKADSENGCYSWMPSLNKLMITEKLLHEYAGLIYYKLIK